MDRTPPGAEQRNKLRAELHTLKLRGTISDLDDNDIEEIVHLPRSLFNEAIHHLRLAYGPLSSFPTTVSQDEPESKPANPVIDDGVSLLEGALAAVTDYNSFLEEKVAKFKTQSTRSLATLKESSDADHNLSAIQDKTAELKRRKTRHAQDIAVLADSLNSYDENRALWLGGCGQSFWNDILFLNCHNTLSGGSRHSAPPTAPPPGLWDEHDYLLQHVERWRRLVNVDSKESEVAIDRAKQHVNQLVYSITRHCQAQLATIFYESLAGSPAAPNRRRAVHEEAADIIKEIDWLWEEVVPVAHMSVSAQYLHPVLKTFEDWERSKSDRDAIVTTYASGALKFMNDRLSIVAQRTQALVYHHKASLDVAQRHQLNQTSEPQAKIPERVSHTSSHNTQKKRKSDKALENLRAFMQIYGAAPLTTRDLSSKPTASLLDEYVQTRTYKSEALLRDFHKLLETAARFDLTDRELGGASLLETLLADSAASSTQAASVYRDAELEGSITMLRGQAEQVQKMFQGLRFEGPVAAADYVAHSCRQYARGESPNCANVDCVRGVKFEEFVRRWDR